MCLYVNRPELLNVLLLLHCWSETNLVIGQKAY